MCCTKIPVIEPPSETLPRTPVVLESHRTVSEGVTLGTLYASRPAPGKRSVGTREGPLLGVHGGPTSWRGPGLQNYCCSPATGRPVDNPLTHRGRGPTRARPSGAGGGGAQARASLPPALRPAPRRSPSTLNETPNPECRQ